MRQHCRFGAMSFCLRFLFLFVFSFVLIKLMLYAFPARLLIFLMQACVEFTFSDLLRLFCLSPTV